GRVHLAKDHQLNTELAIKQISKTHLQKDDYFKEAQLIYLSEHQYITPIKYACETDDHIYLAMPFYSKGSLARILEKRFLTVREIISYSIQILSAIHNIHSRHLLHFDIKPDNILISDASEAHLTDFGLAKH